MNQDLNDENLINREGGGADKNGGERLEKISNINKRGLHVT